MQNGKGKVYSPFVIGTGAPEGADRGSQGGSCCEKRKQVGKVSGMRIHICTCVDRMEKFYQKT